MKDKYAVQLTFENSQGDQRNHEQSFTIKVDNTENTEKDNLQITVESSESGSNVTQATPEPSFIEKVKGYISKALQNPTVVKGLITFLVSSGVFGAYSAYALGILNIFQGK
jgi:hypothetical protein